MEPSNLPEEGLVPADTFQITSYGVLIRCFQMAMAAQDKQRAYNLMVMAMASLQAHRRASTEVVQVPLLNLEYYDQAKQEGHRGPGR